MTKKTRIYPNLFIVGAAKAGTTSLHDILAKHPDIHMSVIKEPHFMLHDYFTDKKFNGPGDNEIIQNYINDENAYNDLFIKQAKINGETSPGYFSLPDYSIKNIKNHCKSPKIIICLRNPIDRTYSAYMHKRRNGLEKKEFNDILRNELEQKRIKDVWAWGWYYLADSLFYEKVLKFKAAFDSVKIIFFEDLISYTEDTLNDIYDFLGVKRVSKSEKLEQNNKTGIIRNRALYKLVHRIYPLLSFAINKKMKNKAKNFFVHKPKMDEESKVILQNYFRDDITKLSQYLEIDLFSKWKIQS
jgi:hypothetical protein